MSTGRRPEHIPLGELWPGMSLPEKPPEAPGFGISHLVATVYGDDIPQMRTRAMERARELYGNEAELRVVRTSAVRTTISGMGRGKFTCDITVRCLDFPGEAL